MDGEQKAEVEVQLKDIKRRLDRANGSANGRSAPPQVMVASIQMDNGVNGTSVTGANNDQLDNDGEPTEGLFTHFTIYWNRLLFDPRYIYHFCVFHLDCLEALIMNSNSTL